MVGFNYNLYIIILFYPRLYFETNGLPYKCA